MAWVVCFAIWTLFSVIGIKIKENLGLTNAEFGVLIATPVLTGAVSRLFLGMLADQYGGRIIAVVVMLLAATSSWLLASASTYQMYLAAALGIGLAGGYFAIGVAYVSRWTDKEKQGTSLGIFGFGQSGAAITSFFAPMLLVAYGWADVAKIYAMVVVVFAAIFWFTTEDEPGLQNRKNLKRTSFLDQFTPLGKLQVWRFAVYYFFVFGAFVALTLWLPRYYMGVYNLNIETAGILTTIFTLPAGIFRAVGGILSDKIGARKVMYITFITCVICTFILSYPPTTYTIHGINHDINFQLSMGLASFVAFTGILSVFMSFGMAAVYKHIPVYYPLHVGSVGGVVGFIGGLGGFFLPIIFGVLNDLIGIWTSCFMLLFMLVAIALVWMHITIMLMEKKQNPALRGPKFLPELQETEQAIS